MIKSKRSNALIRVLWGLVLCLLLSRGSAAIFENLYTVTVPLSSEALRDQAPSTEEDYMRFAMGQLLTRVTGRLDAFLDPALEDLVQDAAQYVVQRGYPDRENLIVTFDSRAIEDVLVQRSQPVWGEERPLTLMWVAIDAGFGERSILGAAPPGIIRSEQLTIVENELRAQLESAASDRGLPVTLPLWDLQDISALDFIDIWGGFGDRVRRASERYGADAILSGRVRVTQYGFDTQWTLLRGRSQYTLSGGTLRSGLDQLADLYAGEFSSIGNALIARVTVTDVETLENYGAVMRYMEGLSILDSVDVEDFTGTMLTLRVAARGGPDVLERVLILGDVLTQSSSTVDSPSRGHLTFSLSQ
ncbi:MAG: DUF2066 domain-containing protein [Pseudomonadota bacterium]|nr:DUF2066 domain-containing protein [Pseudomonadota bacterium]